jgi:hypothetical protein
MDRETIIKLAREVYGENAKWEGAALERLERFAKLVAEHVIKDAPDYKMGYADGVAVEREALAAYFEAHWRQEWTDEQIAAAIRARGNT